MSQSLRFTAGHLALSLTMLGLFGLAAGTRPVRAADLDYGDAPPPVAEEKVEFGSNWYIRGDVGVTRVPSINLTAPANLPTEANPSVAPPDAPGLSVGSSHNVGYVASLGGGYQFNNYLRSDLIVDFHQPITATKTTGNAAVFCPTGVSYASALPPYGNPTYADGGCTGTYQSKLSSYDALVNGYIDLGTWSRVTPYIGAGVGVAFGHYSTSATYVQSNGKSYNGVTFFDPKFATTFYQNYDRSSSGSYQTLAWALMGGFSVDVYDHTKLDVGYRYLSLGAIPGISGTLTSQEVRAGLRYMIDN